MDPNLFIIFAFILVIVPIAGSIGSSIHRRTNEHEERKLELEARKAEAESGQGGASYRKLEERVRVLERIATDSNHALASQIEELRSLDAIDDRAIEDRSTDTEIAR